ncbi:MAG: DUF1150 domain-containing protein [Beijerinckiaceae bacterium]|nr:DUF1150 domain-containing protein [Beijerinckiaceae bacterium]
MTKTDMKNEFETVTPEALAALGGGEVAYVKAIRSDDVKRIFPQAPQIQPGLNLFALLAADGSPIMLTDSYATAVQNAWEHELVPVSVH